MSRPVSITRDRSISEAVKVYMRKAAKQLFFTKHVDWRGENEYRWIFYDSDESGTGPSGCKSPYVEIRNNVVAGIVLGGDYSNAHLPVARMFAEVHGLEGNIVRCRWSGLALYLDRFSDDGEKLIPLA